MKYLLTIILLIILSGGCNGGGGSDSDKENDITTKPWVFNSSFSDEFNDHQLDKSKWYDHNPQWEGRHPGLFCSDNVWVRNGYLHLRISYDESLPDDNIYVCSAIKSKEPILYGKIEARIKIIDGYAASGFWLYNVEPDEWTELGIIETIGGNPEWETLVHFSSYVWKPYEYHDEFWYDTNIKLADDFHIYGIEWTPFEVRRYFDGILIDNMSNKHWFQELYINFSMEVWYWDIMPKPEDLPKEMLVDWIRVYQ